MSTGASYLNSNVSLISNASIRYEGTLYSINPQEATITLSSVRSYGTEDRKVDKFLAPKDTLFEYIIFKANDIKELIVDEPFNDPAIVTATQRPNSTNNGNAFSGFSENSNLQANGLPTEQSGLSNNQASAPSVSSAGQNDRIGSTSPSSHAHSPTSELSLNKQQKQDSNKTRQQSNYQNNNRQTMQNNQRRGTWDNNRVNNSYYQNNQRYDRNRPAGYYQNNLNRRNQYPNSYQNQHAQNYRGRQDNRNGQFRNNNQFRNNQMYQNNQRFKPVRKFLHQDNKKLLVDPTDFDFEKANEDFNKLVDDIATLNLENGEKSEKSGTEDNDTTANTTKSNLDREVDEDGNYYDKKKSFFDNISCEAIERTKGSQQKFDWKTEKKLNAETFGIKIVYRRPDGSYRRNFGFINNNRYGNPIRRYNNGNQRQQQRPPQSQQPQQARNVSS